jgi:hypothetical protein
MTNIVINYGAVVMAFALSIVVFYMAKTGRLRNRDDEMPTRLKDLEGLVRVLQADHVKDANRIADLERKLAEAQERIRFLEAQQGADKPATPDRFAAPELLVVFGPDPAIVDADRLALRKARIDFERLHDATPDIITEELQARREDGKPVRWLHVSSHGNEQGILFSDGKGGEIIVGSDFWAERLTGIEVVFLSVCQGVNVARDLVGVVTHVVYFREGVNPERAATFAGVFWGGVVNGLAVEDAFYSARKSVPEVREFAALRVARRTKTGGN